MERVRALRLPYLRRPWSRFGQWLSLQECAMVSPVRERPIVGRLRAEASHYETLWRKSVPLWDTFS